MAGRPEIDCVDVAGNLETIEHLAQVGQLLVAQDRWEHIPTILECIYGEAQHLTFEYAVKENANAND